MGSKYPLQFRCPLFLACDVLGSYSGIGCPRTAFIALEDETGCRQSPSELIDPDGQVS